MNFRMPWQTPSTSAEALLLAALLGTFRLGVAASKTAFLGADFERSPVRARMKLGPPSSSAGMSYNASLATITRFTIKSGSYAVLLLAGGTACSSSARVDSVTATAESAGRNGAGGSGTTGAGGASDTSGASASSSAGVMNSAGQAGSATNGGGTGGTTMMGGGGVSGKENGGIGGVSAAAGSAGATQAGSCAGVFCEDFEGGSIDTSVWNIQQSGKQTLKVETNLVAHGKYAVQFYGAPNVQSSSSTWT